MLLGTLWTLAKKYHSLLRKPSGCPRTSSIKPFRERFSVDETEAITLIDLVAVILSGDVTPITFRNRNTEMSADNLLQLFLH